MQSVKRTLETLIRPYTIDNKWYYTRSRAKNKASLYSMISPMGNPRVDVAAELDSWVQKGNKVRFAELRRIIVDLRKRNRYSQALQVSEWMKNKGTYTFTPVEHAVQLDLIGRVRGFVSAEEYFNNLSEQEKTEKTQGALLHCYVRQRQTEKAFAHLQKMKENGLELTSVVFSDIMSLYTSIGELEKVPDVFNQMLEHGVIPDNFSYRICINSYGVRSDIEGMEKALDEMEKQPHIVMDWNTYASVANSYIKAGQDDKANAALKLAEEKLDDKDGLGYNYLIFLHARLGNKAEVLRLWALEKKACKKCINRDYINMLKSLVNLDALVEAEKLLEEWETSRNSYDFRVPCIVVDGYVDKGLNEMAETMLIDMMENGKATTPDGWGRVSVGYLEKGDIGGAMRSLDVALSLHKQSNNEDKLDVKLINRVLKLAGEKGSSKDAENILNMLRSSIALNTYMYHSLLTSYVSSGKEVDAILDIMRVDNIVEDETTKKILSTNQCPA